MEIRIPHEDVQYTYKDFDLMVSVNANRNKLMEGKTIKTGLRNTLTVYAQCIVLIMLPFVMNYFLQDTNRVLTYVFVGAGCILFLMNALLSACSYYSYRKTVQFGTMRSDIVFDEKGIHAWESPEKGFDADWESITNCFITKKWIYILFQNQQLVVDIPATKENKEKIIQGLKLGFKLSFVKFLLIEKGQITVRNQ